ncbi:MAG: DnaJ domain-containing protein [Polyangiaceae bacterium]|nr:DnaJ domain-containing protein [Polyangiaceae bacterium]
MNAYKILQVDPSAEREVIEAAYRRLASKYHPDKDPSPDATARMKELNGAYEVLKDPERRAEYDRQRKRIRAEKLRPQSKPEEPNPVVSQGLAEEVSNRLFRRILWAAACVALLVYFPWGVALLIGGWGLIWAVKRHPGVVVKCLSGLVGLAAFAGAYLWVQSRAEDERKKKTERELAALDIAPLLDTELGAFAASCVRTASQKAPELADAYCRCLADNIRMQFDMSPVNADSLEDYRTKFSARFRAAVPSEVVQATCVDQVRPKPATLPVRKVASKKKRPLSPNEPRTSENVPQAPSPAHWPAASVLDATRSPPIQ